MTAKPPRRVPGVARDASSITAILDELADEGFAGSLTAEADGTVTCGSCGRNEVAAAWTSEQFRRLEGASDPDEMLMIAALRCPHCSIGGALVLTYGPEVTEADAAVLEHLVPPPPPPVPDP